MNKAYIYFNDKNLGKDYSGEGPYVLVFEEQAIASHYCSNRSFANHDLTVWKLEKINEYNIDEIYSNENLVWKRESKEINDKTQTEFEVANDCEVVPTASNVPSVPLTINVLPL